MNSGPAAAGPRAGSGFGMRDFGALLKNRGLILFSAIAALVQVVTFSTVMSFTPDHVRVRLDASGRELAFLSVVYSVACIAGASWVRTKFCSRIPKKYQLAAAFSISAVYCAVVPAATGLPVVYLMQVFVGVGQAASLTMTMALALNEVPHTDRSAAMGVYQSVYSLGMTLGPVMMGGFIDLFGGFAGASRIILIVCGAGIILCLTAVRRTK